ncbi:MAG: DUF1559 family PulG-like putative transporter [Aureliella sp.]
MRRSSRHGFTLVELLVVIAIIGVLVGLLLPAVQAAREAARRAECASRMGELAKATQLFEGAKKRYPGHLEAFGKTSAGVVKVGTWAVALFPYLENEPVYDLWQDQSTTTAWNTAGGYGSANAANQFYPNIGIFTCSSDTMSEMEAYAKNSFVCNAGFFPDTPPAAYSSLSLHEISQRSSGPQNGVFSNQLPAKIAACYTGGSTAAVLGSRAALPTKSENIKDGLTQTIAFSENLQADGWGYVGKSSGWATTTVGSTTYAGDDLDKVNSPRVHTGFLWLYRTESGANPVQPTNKINGNRYSVAQLDIESARPSSGHTGLVNVAMLGGSVSTISDGIDYVVYQALMTPHTKASDAPNKQYILKEADYLQ